MKTARLVGMKSGIAVELLDEKTRCLILARLPDCKQESERLLIGGTNALQQARFVYHLLKKRGYEISVDISLQVDKLVNLVGSGCGSSEDVRKLVACLGFRWVGIDIKLEIGHILAKLYSRNARGEGLNGFRIVEIAAYTNMVDNIEAKNQQIRSLLVENDELRAQLAHKHEIMAEEIC